MVDPKNKVYQVSAVALKKAPIMMCYYKHFPVSLILDTGAEHNVISDTVVKRLGIPILKTSSQAQQVDKSRLNSIGRISVLVSNASDSWQFDALVCVGVGDVVIAGNPFLQQGINPITYKNITEIISKDGSIRTIPWRPMKTVPNRPTISLLRTPEKVTVFPDEYFEIEAPPEVARYESSEILLLPRMHSKTKVVDCSPLTQPRPSPPHSPNDPNPDHWPAYDLVPFPPPQFTHIVGGKIRILNTSPLPVKISKNDQIANIRIVSDQLELWLR